MLIATVQKQPSEVSDYNFSYADWLINDSLADVNVAVDQATLDVGAPVILGDNSVNVRVSAGDSGVTYKLTLLARTVNGLVKEDEFKIKVKDV